MIASGEWLDLTRAIGLAAYSTAVTCCAIAWLRTKPKAKAGGSVSRLAAILMLVDSALLLDMAFNGRWKLHQALMDFAIRKHEYANRGLPQLVTVILLACLLLFGLFVCWRAFRGRGTTLLAVDGVLLSVIMWCIEVVSLHAVDHVLYHVLGGAMSVSLLWVLACTMTSIGILFDPR